MGKGAEFIVTLPLVLSASVADTPAKTVGATATTGVPTIARRRILVVDDNTDAAVALSALLRKHGHEVLEVHNGTEAMQAFEGFRPEIVLLDIGMPGVNGLEVARHLRSRNRSPRTLIIAVTGWGKTEDELASRDAGFDLHLVKPVDEADLLNALGNHARMLH